MIFWKLKQLLNKQQYVRAGRLLKIKGINMLKFCRLYQELDFISLSEPVLIKSERFNELFWFSDVDHEDINDVPVFTFTEFSNIAKEYASEYFGRQRSPD